MRMFKKDEGFTLVELMVVVLIIGILVAIAIPVFNRASASARQRTCHANMRTIEGAVEQYLAASPNNTRAQCNLALWESVLVGTTNYIKVTPLCPSGRTDAPAVASYTYDGVEVAAPAPTDLQAICGSNNVTSPAGTFTATNGHVHYSAL